MQVKPNRTVVVGRVTAMRLRADGWGADVDVEVARNISPSPDDDFLRPENGATIRAFTAEPAAIATDTPLRVNLTLRAGPGGGQAVIESTEPASA